MGHRPAPDLELFWGKSSSGGAAWLPVLAHLRDTASVIGHVADTLVPAGLRDRVAGRLGEASWRDVMVLAALAHDVGKVSVYFQPKVPELYGRVRDAGFTGDPPQADLTAAPHPLVGALTLADWLRARAGRRVPRRTLRGWRAVVGGHHGVFPSDAALERVRTLLDREPAAWSQARHRMLDLLVDDHGIGDREIAALAAVPWEDRDVVTVTGALIAADWVASSETAFPYDLHAVPPAVRAARGRAAVDLGGRWRPGDGDATTFARRFGLPAGSVVRPVQAAAVRAATELDGPGMLVIENETGAGKTEAALAAAEILARRLDLDGLFFAQPTRVTSDAMYDRVRTWLTTGDPSAPVSLILAHGKAELHGSYAAGGLSAQAADPTCICDDGDPAAPGVEATAWFRGRRTALLASVVVGTIDQLLVAALRSRHLAMRHAGLAGKVVVVDEVHAADSFMQRYLHRALEWLGAYGSPVILLSATLPRGQREALVAAYHRGLTGSDGPPPAVPDDTGYPRLTAVSASGVRVTVPGTDGRPRFTRIDFRDGDLPEMAATVRDLTGDGGCVGVVCSTVSRAQELYRLVTASGDVAAGEVVLLHSRFPAGRRARIEADLVAALGRRGLGTRPRRLIVISTQIIEQGLDLDLDALVSDIAPVDLIIQRIGRVHRHRDLGVTRPPGLATPRVLVFGAGVPDESAPPPVFPAGVAAVYGDSRLLAGALLLGRAARTRGGVTSPDDVARLVDLAYSGTPDVPQAWRERWDRARREEDERDERRRHRADALLIPPPGGGTLDRWSSTMSVADESVGAAQVRDADDGPEVVLVRRAGDRIRPLVGLTAADVPVDGPVPDDTARDLARCTVRLPAWVVRGRDGIRELEQDAVASWARSRWLRGCQALVLGEDLTRRLGDRVLRYDDTLGLVVTTEPGGGAGMGP